MAGSDLPGMATSELEQRLVESRQELFNLRFQLATGQLDNNARLGHVRRDVARGLTLLRARQLDEPGEDDGAVAQVVDEPASPVRSRRRLGRRRADGQDEGPVASEEGVAGGDEVEEAATAAGDAGPVDGADDEAPGSELPGGEATVTEEEA